MSCILIPVGRQCRCELFEEYNTILCCNRNSICPFRIIATAIGLNLEFVTGSSQKSSNCICSRCYTVNCGPCLIRNLLILEIPRSFGIASSPFKSDIVQPPARNNEIGRFSASRSNLYYNIIHVCSSSILASSFKYYIIYAIVRNSNRDFIFVPTC